jgi:hypothetical protein
MFELRNWPVKSALQLSCVYAPTLKFSLQPVLQSGWQPSAKFTPA